MSFLRAARAARAGQSGLRGDLRRRFAAGAIMILVFALALLFVSCSTSKAVAPNHSAYVTLPDDGSVLMLQINGTTGAISTGAQTPQVQGTSPTGLALLSTKKFLYAANSRANTISTFSVNGDGTLRLAGTPIQGREADGPNAAVIDPSEQYLFVTNNFSNNISVFQIDSGTGVLTEVPNSPFYANLNPTDLVFTPSGQFVYVTNPGLGMVTGFVFCPLPTSGPPCTPTSSVLTQVSGSPVLSGSGAASLVVDSSGRFLYVANVSASNPPPNANTVGNISGYNIDSGSGVLTPINGSPFTSVDGSGPSTLVIAPNTPLVYAMTPGTSFSIWCFTIDQTIGPTSGQLVEEPSSPFSLAAGGLFAVFDPSANYLYVGSNSGINAYTYDQSTGTPTILTGSPFSTGVSPGKMVFLQ
jgi:6-phosphogluconolactonase